MCSALARKIKEQGNLANFRAPNATEPGEGAGPLPK